MSNPETITAELFEKTGALLGSVDLSDASDIEFYDATNECGTGSLSLPLADTAAGELTPGRFVNIKVDGTSRFTFKIEGNPQYRMIQRGMDAEQVVTVQGRGWACIFDEAVIYPSAALDSRIDHSWRLYSFASPNFPNTTGWALADQIHDWLDGADSGVIDCYFHAQRADDGNFYPAPINFPWAISPENYDVDNPPGAGYESSYWIRPDASLLTSYRDTGYYFFRNTFTHTGGTVTFDVTGDNYFTFFLEGVPILGENADHFIWKGWKSVALELPSGTYDVAAVVHNTPHPENVTYPACAAESFAGATDTKNPGGFLMAAYTGVNAPTDLLITSDNTWNSWYSNDRWPGWTPGQIIADLITEASGRTSGLAVYDSDTFTDTLDSGGLAWRPLLTTLDSPYLSIAFDTGSTILEALQQMHEDGWINWHVRPGTLILDAYRGREPTPSSSATFTAASNIKSLVRAETEKYANALLVQWEEGFVEVAFDGSEYPPSSGTFLPNAISTYGTRVEDIWSSDAPTADEAIEQGVHELYRRAQEGYPAIVMEIEPTGTGDVPYVDFDLLDWITIPAVGGGTELVRVLSIKATQDAEGHAQWTLELNRKLRVQEVEQIDLLRQIGGRSQVVRGRVS